MEPSRPGSAGGIRAKDKKKVGFHPDAEEPPLFRKHRPASITLPTRITLTPPSGLSPGFASSESRRAREAHERGKRLELDERISSAPASRATSPARKLALPKLKLNLSDIPLQDFSQVNVEEDAHERDPLRHLDDSASENLHASAHKLVRAHAAMTQPALHIGPSSGLVSAAATPNYEREAYLDYVPKPERHRAGVLGALLKLYNHDGPSDLGHDRSSSLPRPAHFRDGSSGFNTPQHSPPSSGYNTPISRPVSGYSTPGGRHSKLWHSKSHSNSTSSLAYLVGSSVSGGTPISGLPLGEQVTENLRQRHEAEKRIKKARSSNVLGRIGRPRLEEEIRITKHIAETLARQKYLLKLCRALITYGAPTHRMETYMRMSARVLEVDCQFLYIPFISLASIGTTSILKIQHGSFGGDSSDCHPEGHQEQQHAADTNRGGKFKKKKKEKGKIPTSKNDEFARIHCRTTALRRREFGFRKKDIAEWLIHELDQRTTGGTIAYLTGGIKIIWKERIPGKLGVADVVSGTIQLSEELIDDEQNLRNTVCHEFSHLLAYYYSGRTDHGELFFCWAQFCTDKMRPLDMGPVQIKAPRQDSYEFIWQCEKEDCGQEYGRQAGHH
ncbi:DUF1212-domain-containing protein [Aureobasidium pullulans]|uniref:DUF1212-domain-containing protein n=1 Tax=Aureobasidium pullulans TaxID=5580 RepID=A0A4T0B7L3_AURPU|nr:DUF1212-domain-containing protein [Aureobasidium pullulans]